MWHWWNDDRIAWLLWPGLVAAVIAVVAWVADRRRVRRVRLDEVGFMPWTAIFFVALFLAVVLLGLAVRGFLAA